MRRLRWVLGLLGILLQEINCKSEILRQPPVGENFVRNGFTPRKNYTSGESLVKSQTSSEGNVYRNIYDEIVDIFNQSKLLKLTEKESKCFSEYQLQLKHVIIEDTEEEILQVIVLSYIFQILKYQSASYKSSCPVPAPHFVSH